MTYDDLDVICPPDEVVEAGTQVPCVKPDLNKANPKVGGGALAFSPDNKYFYTRNGTYVLVLGVYSSYSHDHVQTAPPGSKP